MSPAAGSGVRSAAERRGPLARWWLNLPLRDKGLLVVVVLPLTTLVAAVLMRIPYSAQEQLTMALTTRVAQSADAAQELSISLLDLESGVRGYQLNRDGDSLRRVARARELAPVQLERLSLLLFTDADQGVFEKLSALVHAELAAAEQFTNSANHPAGPESASRLDPSTPQHKASYRLSAAIPEALQALRRSQYEIVSRSQDELERRRRRLTPIILVTLFGGLAATLAAGWLFATGIAERVSALERNAERLANGERLQYEPSRGLDEIGSLDLTLRRASLRLRTRERELRDVNARLERTVHEQALLNRPVSELNLSVRARKCMNRLGINTVGDLVSHTSDELLECKNFGVTSLVEVRDKLKALGLKLRGD